MSDLELTRLTAKAMGFDFDDGDADCLMVSPTVADMKAAAAPYPIERTAYSWFRWHPLEDDLQAMALVKRFSLSLWGTSYSASEWKYHAEPPAADESKIIGHGDTHNRAIVTCVARMQQAKAGAR